MFYFDDSDRWYDELDDLFDEYSDPEPTKRRPFTDADKILHGKPRPARESVNMEYLLSAIFEYLDENVPELSTEEDYFSERLSKHEKETLQHLLGYWLTHVVPPLYFPDYDNPVTDVGAEYQRWLKEMDELEERAKTPIEDCIPVEQLAGLKDLG